MASVMYLSSFKWDLRCAPGPDRWWKWRRGRIHAHAGNKHHGDTRGCGMYLHMYLVFVMPSGSSSSRRLAMLLRGIHNQSMVINRIALEASFVGFRNDFRGEARKNSYIPHPPPCSEARLWMTTRLEKCKLFMCMYTPRGGEKPWGKPQGASQASGLEPEEKVTKVLCGGRLHKRRLQRSGGGCEMKSPPRGSGVDSQWISWGWGEGGRKS